MQLILYEGVRKNNKGCFPFVQLANTHTHTHTHTNLDLYVSYYGRRSASFFFFFFSFPFSSSSMLINTHTFPLESTSSLALYFVLQHMLNQQRDGCWQCIDFEYISATTQCLWYVLTINETFAAGEGGKNARGGM